MSKLYGLAIVLGGALMTTQSAVAGDIVCPGYIGPTTIDGTVVVVGDCTLDRTNVDGNVLLEIGGDLLALRARINGNVQTDGAERVRIRRSEIGGDIQLTGLYGSTRSEVLSTAVGGTLDVHHNEARLLLNLNEVTSDLKANNNTGGVSISGNTIGGNLQCQNNSPPPTGGNNIVDGSKEDQCERL
jgi:hypothetical protein